MATTDTGNPALAWGDANTVAAVAAALNPTPPPAATPPTAPTTPVATTATVPTAPLYGQDATQDPVIQPILQQVGQTIASMGNVTAPDVRNVISQILQNQSVGSI